MGRLITRIAAVDTARAPPRHDDGAAALHPAAAILQLKSADLGEL